MKKIFLLLITLFLLIPCSSFADDKQYYFVFLNTNPEREELSEDEVMKLQEGHMNNITRLANEGKLLIAGPVKGGGGIFVLIAPTIEEANEYLQTDPAIKAKRFNLEVYPMNIAEGNLCKVSEDDFQMVAYTLTRYAGEVSYKDKSKILTQIEFEGIDEGIVVLNYDLEKGTAEELNNYFTVDKNIYTKTLWIGKGSFCE
ncbi:MAG: hypothetical protein EHM47_08940 [Ignavibacteriales bacterium]|nr:MAG: hypothetical protein EHM47_08940 [Ignavibacteriales bacterium]